MDWRKVLKGKRPEAEFQELKKPLQEHLDKLRKDLEPWSERVAKAENPREKEELIDIECELVHRAAETLAKLPLRPPDLERRISVEGLAESLSSGVKPPPGFPEVPSHIAKFLHIAGNNLGKDSQKMLRNAQVLSLTLANLPNFDYCLIAVELCKTTEYEIQQRLRPLGEKLGIKKDSFTLGNIEGALNSQGLCKAVKDSFTSEYAVFIIEQLPTKLKSPVCNKDNMIYIRNTACHANGQIKRPHVDKLSAFLLAPPKEGLLGKITAQ